MIKIYYLLAYHAQADADKSDWSAQCAGASVAAGQFLIKKKGDKQHGSVLDVIKLMQ